MIEPTWLEDPSDCPWEDRVARAASAADLDERTRAHVERCVSCRAVASVIHALVADGRTEEQHALARLAGVDGIIALAGRQASSPPRPLPTWTPDRAERVLRPVVWIERVAVLVAIIAFVGLLAWFADTGSAQDQGQRLAGVLRSAAPVAGETDVGTAVLAATGLLIVVITGYGLIGFRTGGAWLIWNGR